MKNRIVGLISAVVLVFCTVTPATIQSVTAQTIEPPPGRPIPDYCRPGEPCEDEKGKRYIISDDASREALSNTPNGIGDSDDYGYTLTETTYSWIDASDGVNTYIDNSNDVTSAISLPFPFPFYDNTYNQVYITGSGYITFGDYGGFVFCLLPDSIPNISIPNKVIAPFWECNGYESSSGVYYKSFSDKFVIEWLNVLDHWGQLNTYEIILYSNGNIEFQYHTIPDFVPPYWFTTAGIEDSRGLDGLPYWDPGDNPSATSASAVLFTRPGSSGRVQITPVFQGKFIYSNAISEFFFTIINTGNLGADTYDFVVSSLWPATLHDPDSGNPLSDTDGDGKIDSGTIPQGGQKEVLVSVTAPSGLSVGDHINTSIKVISSLNPEKNKTATLELTIPAPFAQTFGVSHEAETNEINSELIWPTRQLKISIGQQSWNNSGLAITETPDNHFIHVWQYYEVGEDDSEGMILKYSIIDKLGRITKPVTNLTSINPSPKMYTDDSSYTIVVTPDGKIGIIWCRYLYDNSNGLGNSNIWFAILDSSGRLVFGPSNLTNNPDWGGSISYYSPNIGASGDNRFMLTWEKYASIDNNDDIYYSVRQSNGNVVKPITKLTDSNADRRYWYPKIASLSNNRFLLFYEINDYEENIFETFFRVLNSNGDTVKPETMLDYLPCEDAVQLSGGNILFVRGFGGGISYIIIDNTNYTTVFTDEIEHPSSGSNPGQSSVTKDANNRGILTWTDGNGRYLYYASIDGSNGALLSGPFISHYFEEGINTNYEGQITTTNSWQPASGTDLFSEFSADLYGAEPGGIAILRLTYGNQALTTATGPQLTLTLPDGLSYAADTSGIVPIISGNTVTWNLSDLEFADVGDFTVYISVPLDDPLDTLYDVNLSLTFDGTDIDLTNNDDLAKIMISTMTYLPLINR